MQRRPVTLAKVSLPDIDIDDEVREAAARVATIRAGRNAREALHRAENFQSWRAIGLALLVGRDHALRVSGAARPIGRSYARAFATWAKAHGFGDMRKSTRSAALELAEHLDSVEKWRADLTDKQRRRLVCPLSNVRRWRAAIQHNGRSPADDAVAAWRRFIWCVRALPPVDAAALRLMAQAELANV